MTDFLPFVIAGLVAGSLYGLTATGLVLTYRTSGIFNFGHGALAAAGAYLFYQVRDEWGLPWPVALVVAVGVGGVVTGLALERLALGITGASTAMKIVATIGLLTAIQGVLVAVYGASTRPFRNFLPTGVYSFGGVNVAQNQIIVFVVGAAGTFGVATYLRRSRLGTAMRGVVDDPALLDLAGTSPARVRRWSWVIGSSLAALSGVLVAPVFGLDPYLLSLLVVQAFGAAAIGRFASLPLTYAGGLVIGVAASVSTKYVAEIPVLAGFPPSVPFLVLFVALLLTRSGTLVEYGSTPTRAVGRRSALPAWSSRAGIVALVPLMLAVPSFAGPRLQVYSIGLIFVLVFASLRLLVTTSAQVSLCHVAFLAVGAAAFSHLTTGLGLPWAVALVGAGLTAVPVGAFVAIPAIRLSGLYLAIATFGFGVLVERLLYRTGAFFGGDGLAEATRPHLGLFDAASPKGFYFVILAVVATGLLAVHLLGRSPLGRLLRALGDSPLALATLGTTVNVTRVLVFCLSAFLAGIGGALFAANSGSFGSASFSSFLSLTLVVVLAIAGSGEVRGPLTAAAVLHLVPSYLRNESLNAYLPVMFGVIAVAVAVLSTGARPHIPASQRAVARRAGTSRIRLRARRGPLRPHAA
ncbi:MAG: ABC transporter permease [Actinomycetota bacterium]|nr:ABC transporter permease [Actinomycetota bacterium]